MDFIYFLIIQFKRLLSQIKLINIAQKKENIIFQKKMNNMQLIRAPRLVNVEQHGAIIIDTHGGIEDIIAIISAIELANLYEKQIIGITCVAGRRSVQDAATDALLAVKLCKASIPIYKGVKQPIMSNKPFPQTLNQSNKFDFIDSIKKQVLGQIISEEDLSLIQDQHASRFIAQSAHKYKQNLAVTTFGPLTNLALAFLYNNDVNKIGMVNILGGQYTGVGNVVGQYSAQANFHFDPQATHIIIHNFSHNVFITPIQKVLETDWKQKLVQLQRTPCIDEYKKALLGHLNRYDFVCLGTVLTIFPVMIRKTLKKYYQVYTQVCMQGSMIQGLLAINWFRLDVKQGQQIPNIKICYEFDVERMMLEIRKSWCGVHPLHYKQVTLTP